MIISDVYATIALAKLIKQKQPKLYHYIFELRNKKKVAEQLNWFKMTPFVHVTSRLPAINGCCSWFVPIAQHPSNKNAIIAVNLAQEPSALFELDVDQLRDKLYAKTEELAPGEKRLPIKLIHVNKCPVIAPAKSLSEDNALRLGIDRRACLENLNKLQSFQGLQQKLQSVYDVPREETEVDADHALYTGGFFSDHDRALMEQIKSADAMAIGSKEWPFEDARLKTLLFRYRARNYPATLSENEIERWQRHRQFVLLDPASHASIKMTEYMHQIDILMQENANDPNKQAILLALIKYAENL